MIGDDSSEALGSLIWRLQVGFYCVTWELASLVAFGGLLFGARGLLWQQVGSVVQVGGC